MKCTLNFNDYSGAAHPVKFKLTYPGHIPSGGKSGKSEDKHEVRRYFSDQLYNVWKSATLLNAYLSEGLPEATPHGKFGKPSNPLHPFFVIRQFGVKIYPLVTIHNRLTCRLDMSFTVLDASNRIDTDNRIKFVLDTLRMPQNDDEFPEKLRGVGSDELYCLFEDDGLLRDYTVSVDESNESPSHEELRIMVNIERGLNTHDALYKF